jgi:cytochrome c
VGGVGSLTSENPVKTVGSYWPYATTLFDYTRRAMPLDASMSLTNDEVYAVCAYILHLNGIISEDAIMKPETLPDVKMPNRNGFVQALE